MMLSISILSVIKINLLAAFEIFSEITLNNTKQNFFFNSNHIH